jgi:neutral amino acid transport system substrate-binding protein
MNGDYSKQESKRENKYRQKPALAWMLSLTILSLNILAVGCSDNTSTNTNSTNSNGSGGNTSGGGDGLKLGTLLPNTGDLSSIGQNLPKAAQLAVDTINSCGGVNGKPVTLVNEDDKTDPNAGSDAMTKLTEVDKVAGVVGSFASSVSTAALAIAVRNRVMLISPGSTSPVFTDNAKKGDYKGFWARTAPPDTYQASALANLAHKKGFKKVSTIVINNDYGVGFEKAFVAAFKKLGGTIVNESNPVRYDPKATTLDSEASAAFGNKPDAVAAVLYAETGEILMKSAFEQGDLEGVIPLFTDGVKSEDFVKGVGKTGDGKSIISGALGTVPGADGKALEKFAALWQEKTGKEITPYIPHTWDATILLMLAAEAAKTNTGEGIKSKILEVSSGGQEVTDPCEAMKLIREGKDINFQGASGNVDIDAAGDVIGNYDVWTVEPDGTLKTIDKVNAQ